MGTGSYPGVKRPGRGLNYPPAPSAEVEEKDRTLPPLLFCAFVEGTEVKLFNFYLKCRT